MPEKLSRPVSEAVARGRRRAEDAQPERTQKSGRSMDVLGGEIRRRDLLPLLVLHLMRDESVYGNLLMGAIEEMTEGMIAVNPNTIYPLLRDMEGRGLIEGAWEHPDRRTRRFYSITKAGKAELTRLHTELEPILDSMARSISLIKAELYGAGD
ncbi:MAG TPA: PadR family transcriptional regulator [Solirubrobacterales bacterium]|nr:PadR family transcriptional regulator [Solirubrobacterales bacterium]